MEWNRHPGNGTSTPTWLLITRSSMESSQHTTTHCMVSHSFLEFLNFLLSFASFPWKNTTPIPNGKQTSLLSLNCTSPSSAGRARITCSLKKRYLKPAWSQSLPLNTCLFMTLQASAKRASLCPILKHVCQVSFLWPHLDCIRGTHMERTSNCPSHSCPSYVGRSVPL